MLPGFVGSSLSVISNRCWSPSQKNGFLRVVGLELDDEELDLVEELDTRCLVVREGAMRGGVQGGEEMYVCG